MNRWSQSPLGIIDKYYAICLTNDVPGYFIKKNHKNGSYFHLSPGRFQYNWTNKDFWNEDSM